MSVSVFSSLARDVSGTENGDDLTAEKHKRAGGRGRAPVAPGLRAAALALLAGLWGLTMTACRSTGAQSGGMGTPSSVDLTVKPWFPPVVRQQGNSCAQQAGLYYLLTAERNRQRGVSSRHSPAARLSPYQSYAMLADNQTAGTHVEDGWRLAESMGVPLESDVPHGGSALMHGFDKYVRAASRKPGRWQYWRMRGAEDLPAVRRLLASGHPLACDFQIRGAKLVKLPDGRGTLVKEWGTSGPGHTMVYAGYDESVGWDFNGDGKITNDLDITGDGRLTLADWERGAFLMVNPWGPGWGTGGKAWVPWRTHALAGWPRAWEVASVTAPSSDKPPRLMLKLLIQLRERGSLIITVGTGGREASQPQRTVQPPPFRAAPLPLPHSGPPGAWEVFARTHRPGPFLSSGPLAAPGGGPLELGLDVSDLGENVGRFFLKLSAASGETLDGTLVRASVVKLDRSGRVKEEIPLAGLPVRLPGSGGQWVSP